MTPRLWRVLHQHIDKASRKVNLTQVSCDMSPAFISGAAKQLSNAEITFDELHVIKLLNGGVDEVRRAEVKENEMLKSTRYFWLKNEDNLTSKQIKQFDELRQMNLKTVRPYQIKVSFQEFYHMPGRETGEAYWNQWYFWATRS